VSDQVDDDARLENLPGMQFHRFSPWDVDPKVCAYCGQLPQAHPATATEPRGSQAGDGGAVEDGEGKA
jgi:hypothetical protein